MLEPSTIPARNLQKSYKAIIEAVKSGKRAVVLTTKSKPQAAIISLEDLKKLQQVKSTQAALAMLELAAESREKLKNLPSDLRERADEILYGR